MSIVVTGATGQLGRLVVEELLGRGVPAGQIVATGRRVEALDDLAAAGVVVRAADYEDPDSLREAFAGSDRLLLVSNTDFARRVAQHGNVIDAAAAVGVGFVAYTSIAGADRSSMLLAEGHRETERLLRESGLAYAMLRHGWYIENYTAQLPVYLDYGLAGAAGDARLSAATRADYAAAAATVLSGKGHDNAVYELAGPSFTMPELAETVSAAVGRPVAYTNLPVEQYRQVLVDAGLPEGAATVYADADRAIADGELLVGSERLESLIGRQPTSLAEAVADAASRLPGA